MRTTIFLFLISSLSLSAQSGTVEAVDGLIIGGTQLSTHPDGTIIHDGTEFLLKSGGSWTSLYRKPKVTVTTQNNNNTAYNFHFDDGWVPIGVAHTIVKDYDDSIIELELDSRMTCSAINNGFGIQFELRIDGISPDGASLGSLRVQNLTETVHAYSLYNSLSAGIYSVQMYARCPNFGSDAENVIMDPGGWGQRIVVREY